MQDCTSTKLSVDAKPDAVVMPSSQIKPTKVLLESKGLVDKGRKIGKVAGHPGCCAIPLTDAGVETILKLQQDVEHWKTEGDGCSLVDDALKILLSGILVNVELPSNQQRQQSGSSKTARVKAALEEAFDRVSDDKNVDAKKFQDLISLPESEGGLPSKWEWVGDVLMVPERSFTSSDWAHYMQKLHVWEVVSRASYSPF
jgi:tRNA G37 N-methylase Trm5